MIIGKTRTNQPVEGGQEFEDALLDSETSLENVVDADGNKRFIEGDIILNEGQVGLTKEYGRWSLSGTHLIIVFQIKNTTETTITPTAWSELGTLTLPAYILNKIVPITGSNNVCVNSFSGFDGDLSVSANPIQVYLEKGSTEISINSWTGNEIESDKSYRITFDLLIDNE